MSNWATSVFWQPFDNGRSIGEEGAELGTIVRDEANPGGARITLEDNCPIAPVAVTCALYGWLAHTRYFATAAEAQHAFDQMKPALENILQLVPRSNASDDKDIQPLLDALADFARLFPSR